MYICLCSGYKTSDLEKDVAKNKAVKEIIAENNIDAGCKKCCKMLKAEYKACLESAVSSLYIEIKEEILELAAAV
jgi:bacterioferritin-associated ferredoxin